MNRKDILFFILLIFFWIIFFRKSFFQGLVPIPGNLQISSFFPWSEMNWPQYPGGVYKQGLFGFDTIRQIYPWRKFSTEQILKGQMPLWNPYQFSGAPHLANFQTAIFYPLNLIYFVLPQIYAWTILLLIQPLLAGIFMYMLARKFKLSRTGAIFSAFSWAFSLTLSVWLVWNIHGHQFMYLPLILYFIERFKENANRKYLFWLTGILTLTFLAGHPQIFIFIFIFTGVFFFYRTKRLKEWFIIFIAVLGLTAVAWIPLVQYYSFASREIPSSEFNFKRTLLPWQNLITLIAPDFLGNPTTNNYWGKNDYTENAFSTGIVVFIFSLIAFFTKKNNLSKFFIYTIPIVFALCLDWFLPRFLDWLKVPIFTSSIATRVLFLASFSFSLLAGFGLDEFLNRKKFPKIILTASLAFIGFWIWILLIPKIFHYQNSFENLQVMKRNLILPTILCLISTIVLSTKLKNLRRLAVFFLLLIVVLEQFYVANKVIPFTYKELVFPSSPIIEFLQKNSEFNRFTGLRGSNIESNFSTFYEIYSAEGYDTLYPRWYGEVIWGGYTGKYQTDISRTTAVLPKIQSWTQYRLEDLLGIKYVITNKKTLNNKEWNENFKKNIGTRYNLVWSEDNWLIFQNNQVYPRAYLADNYIVINQPKEAIEKIYDREFDPLKTIILDEQPKEKTNFSQIEGIAQIKSYEPNKIAIRTVAQNDKILFLSDTYCLGWNVFIDGVEKKIYKADYAFRAVIVPAGEHNIVFSYQPKSFKIGLAVSLFSILIIILFLILKS